MDKDKQEQNIQTSGEQEQTASQPVTQEQINAWTREQFQKAQKHLAEKGVMPKSVIEKESRYLPPLVALWKMKAQNGKRYWVLSGRLPTDHVESSAAASPREALRYFSFQWQIKAQSIIDSGIKDQTQLDFANLLVNRAHGLYELYEKDELWREESV